MASVCETLKSRLGQLIQDIIADHGMLDGPEKEQAAEFTREQVKKLFDNPKVSELEFVLHKRITADEARHILFFPDEDQAAYYPRLITTPATGAPVEHPQRALQIPYLSLLYLQHWKRWNFVSGFIFAGGLHALCGLFMHSNLVVRMKAVNTFATITSHSAFDWFCSPRSSTEARLHQALLALRTDPGFLSGLIANSWGSVPAVMGYEEDTASTANGKTFPGGALMCLELLAMWLSWVRKLHTADGTLKLSKKLFEAIKSWSGEGKSSGGGWGNGPWKIRSKNGTEESAENALITMKNEGTAHASGSGGNPKTIPNGGEGVKPQGQTALKDTAPGKILAESAEEDVSLDDNPPMNGSQRGECQEEGKEEESMALEGEDSHNTAELNGRNSDQKHKGQREERARIVDLSKRLVEDFGRFPLADEEWKEVRPVLETQSEPTGNGPAILNEETIVMATEHTSAIDEEDVKPTPGVSADARAANGVILGDAQRVPCKSNEISEPVQITQQDDDNPAPTSRTNTISEPNSPAMASAEDLRARGNEAFRKGNFDAAREAYTTAISLLERDISLPLPSQQPPTVGQPQESSNAEKLSALRAVLYRNRAAVSLRLFDSAVAERPPEQPLFKPLRCSANNKEGGDEKFNKDTDSRAYDGITTDKNNKCSLPARKDFRKSERAAEDEVERDEARLLLKQCEEDCLRAIEFDGGDKKARFRLTRCRELKDRCRRGGLRACVDKDRVVRDGQRQRRKKELVAKILARANGSHEVCGGTGSKITASSTGSDKPPVAEDIGCESPAADRGDEDTAADGVSGRADDTDRQSGVSSVQVTESTVEIIPSGPLPAVSSLAENGEEPVTLWDSGKSENKNIYSSKEIGAFRRDDAKQPSPVMDVTAEDSNTAIPTPPYSFNSPTSRCSPSRADLEGLELPYSPPALVTDLKRMPVSSSGSVDLPNTELRATARATEMAPSSGASLPRSRLRILRGRLEELAARSAGKGDALKMPRAASQGDEGGTKQVWEFLLTLAQMGAPLGQLFGDGITEKSLVGVVRALKYACDQISTQHGSAEEAHAGLPGETACDNARTTERVYKLFLELAEVKRVSLVCDMCSDEVRQALRDTHAQLLNVCHHSSSSNTVQEQVRSTGRDRDAEPTERDGNWIMLAGQHTAGLEAAAAKLRLPLP